MKRILFYYPSNTRTNALETLMISLKEKGYEVVFLSLCAKGVLHEQLIELGIKSFSSNINSNNRLIYYLKQFFFLNKFCKENHIDVVFSHLQQANIIAVFSQFFISSNVIIFRHHFNYVNLLNIKPPEIETNRNEFFFDKIINSRAKKIIVPSNSVKECMVKYEGANEGKISVMQYLYDFTMYNKPNEKTVIELKKKYGAKLVLLMCSRLIKLKGHSMVFGVINSIVKETGADIKMLVLDDGPEKAEMENYILDHQLENHIFMLGYCNDIVSVMESCDLMIHPSLTEASNSAVKEMALLGKTSVVCAGVGDFSDYFVNEVNGFLIDPNEAESEIKKIILNAYNNKSPLTEMGNKLAETVKARFGVTDSNVEQFIKAFDS